MKTLYIECHMGAAGDMLMASLYELLEDQEGFLEKMNSLGLPGVRLEAAQGKTCGIAGTHMRVTVHGEEETEHGHGHEHSHSHEHKHSHEHGHSHHHHASPGHIGALIEGLDLPREVKDHAKEVYAAIARAEAEAHGCPVGDVHFHEVGALDAVADVTGVCYALYLLRPERILVSPIHVGSGMVRCAHGIMPVPAPATVNLLKGIPSYGGQVKGELCTPTGAALLGHFADSFGPMPVMENQGIGLGIGTTECEQANCVRAFLGETWAEGVRGPEEGKRTDDGERKSGNGQITELVCNLDDMTPEALSFACARLLELGALDVYTVPGTMKKGRPGHVLTVLCRPEQEARMAGHILAETTTNGLRARRCEKYFLKPEMETVETRWGDVRIKTASGYGVTHRKPEYEDVARLARENQTSYCQIWEEAAQGGKDQEGQGEG